MADSTSSPAPTCDVDGTCYCPLTGVIDTLSQKYAMQLISIIGAHESPGLGRSRAISRAPVPRPSSKRLDEFEDAGLISNSIQ